MWNATLPEAGFDGPRSNAQLTSMDELRMMCRIQQDPQAWCSRARLASNKTVGWCWKCLQHHLHAGITFTIYHSASWSNPLCGFSSGSLTCQRSQMKKGQLSKEHPFPTCRFCCNRLVLTYLPLRFLHSFSRRFWPHQLVAFDQQNTTNTIIFIACYL